MRQRSITGPLILVVIGIIFLLNNLGHDIPFWTYLQDYWPFLLIGIGVIRLAEVLFHFSHGEMVATSSGGGWVFWTIVLCIFMGIWGAGRRGIHIGRLNTPGTVGILGSSYEYSVSASNSADGVTRIIFDNLDGSLAVHGDDGGEVKVTGRKTVRAFSRSDADRANNETSVKMERQGDSLILRAADPAHSSMLSITTDLDIVVPKGINVEARGRGDLNVEDMNGTVTVTEGRGDIRLNKIGKDIRVDSSRSGLFRATAVKGTVDLQGRGGDIQMEDIAGPVTINGAFSGTLDFRNLAKPIHFESTRSDLRIEQIPGTVTIDLGQIKMNNVVGPVKYRTGSRDVEVNDFTSSLELDVEHGDIQVTASNTPVPKMDIHARSGEITLTLPEKGAFELEGKTGGGEVTNEFGSPLETHTDGRSSTIKGKTGSGPTLVVATDRGNLSVRKK